MIDVRDVGSNDPDGILLLDIGVERVIEEAVVWRVHLAREVGRVGDRVEHVAFEPVQRLDRQGDSFVFGVARNLLQVLRAAVQLAPALVRRCLPGAAA